MAIVVPNVARLKMLEVIQPLLPPPIVKLFKNNTVPDEWTDTGDLEEADFPGYAAQETNEAPLFQVNPISGRAEVAFGNLSWTRSTAGTPQVCYGYYVIGEDNLLAWCERFADPQVLQLAGDGFRLPVVFSMWSHPTA